MTDEQRKQSKYPWWDDPFNTMKVLIVILVVCEVPLITDQFFVEVSPWVTIPAEVGVIISFLWMCYQLLAVHKCLVN